MKSLRNLLGGLGVTRVIWKDVAENYLDLRDCSKDYRSNLYSTAKKMQGCGLTVTNVTPDLFNTFITSLKKVSSVTRANYRRQGLTLVKHLLGVRFEKFNHQVKKVKSSFPPPVAWSKSEMKTLVATAASLPGFIQRSECPAKLYFSTWILVAYETGIRWSDQFELNASQLRGERLFVMQNKTRQPIGKRLSLQAQELLAQMIQRSPDGTIFKWAINERNQRIRFQRLIAEAGLIGTPKFLRRSGATYVEAEQPGAASVFLGHRSPEVAEMSYIDTTLIPSRSPKPPSLFEFSTSAEDCPAVSSP